MTTPPDDAATPPRPRRHATLVRLLQLFVAAAALTGLFLYIPLKAVAAAIAGAEPWLLLLAAVNILLAHYLVAYRLKRLTDTHALALTTPQVLGINLATLFYGLFLPAGNFVGIAVRFHRLSGSSRNLAAAAVALLLDRLWATATLCLVGAAFWFLERPPGTELVPIVLVGALVGLLTLVALLATPLRLPGGAAVARAALRFPKLRTLHTALHDSRSFAPAHIPPIALLSILAHLQATFSFWLVAAALGVDLSLISTGWVRAAMLLAATLPISIAGLGVREGAAVALLSAYGIAPDEALAFSLLTFAVTALFPAALGGLLELRRLR